MDDIELMWETNLEFRAAILKVEKRLEDDGFDLSELFSIQPLEAPTGKIFKLNVATLV